MLLPVGQKGQAWEPSEEQCSYVNWVASGREVVSVGVERVDCLIGRGNSVGGTGSCHLMENNLLGISAFRLSRDMEVEE